MLRSLNRQIGNILQNGGAYLGRLRTSPENAISNVSIAVRQSAYMGLTTGGPCNIFCHSLGLNFYELQAVPGTGDYFFPYVGPGAGGVGSVLVPLDAPLGTIVFTNSMQGCAVQVNRRADGYEFYHDANGKSMDAASGKSVEAIAYYEHDRVYRYTAHQYWRQKDDMMMISGRLVRYQFIFIKQAARWLVVQSIATETPEGQNASSEGSRMLGVIL